ncbi:MAG: hypothetical protein ACHP9Y_04770, partial [Gammaproteobacteria bacterium]
MKWWTSVSDEEQRPFLKGQQTIQEEGAEVEASSTGWVHWAYAGVFGRKGWLSSAPIFPGPNLPSTWEGSKTEWAYFGFRDAVQKTLGFFASQSMSSTALYHLNKEFSAPPSQQFDIRYVLTQQTQLDFSFFSQCKNLSVKMPTSIFWLILVPVISRALLFFVSYSLSSDTKARTTEAFSEVNSWKECLKLYGLQAVEVLLANVLVNWAALSMGSSEEAVLNDPTLNNGLKVAVAIGLNFIRTGVEKVLTTEPVKEGWEKAKASFHEKGFFGSVFRRCSQKAADQ